MAAQGSGSDIDGVDRDGQSDARGVEDSDWGPSEFVLRGGAHGATAQLGGGLLDLLIGTRPRRPKDQTKIRPLGPNGGRRTEEGVPETLVPA